MIFSKTYNINRQKERINYCITKKYIKFKYEGFRVFPNEGFYRLDSLGHTNGLLTKIIHINLFYISYTLNKAQQWSLTSINCALSFYIMRILCIDRSHFYRIFHTKYRHIQSLLSSCICSIYFRYLR